MKNFQLHFAPKAFYADAEAWRAVIHLNLVHAVNFILSLLTNATTTARTLTMRSVSSLSNYGRPTTADPLRHLRMRLSPLNQVELILERRLCGEPLATRRASYDPLTPRSVNVPVRARSGWKALARIQRPTSSTSNAHDELLDTRQILEACKDDIIDLWTNEAVQSGLKERDIVLEDHSR